MSLNMTCGAAFVGVRLLCIRNMSRNLCPSYPEPRCGPLHLSKLRCDLERIKIVMSSYYFKPSCCPEPCPTMPRLDDLHYKPTDKLCRMYPQTWVEQPPTRRTVVPVCRNRPPCLPPIERRVLKSRKRVDACCVSSKCWDLMPCRNFPKVKCMRLLMEHCQPAHSPPKCKIVRRKSDCTKTCTPYPSFSECIRKAPLSPHPIECRCLYIIPFCPPDSLLPVQP